MQAIRQKSTAEKIFFSVSLILCALSLTLFVFSFFHLRPALRYESLLLFMLSAVICTELCLIAYPKLTCIISVWVYVLLSFILRETKAIPLFTSPVFSWISVFLLISLAVIAALEFKAGRKRNIYSDIIPYEKL